MLQNRKLFDVAQTEEDLVFNMRRFALIFSIKASLLGIGSHAAVWIYYALALTGWVMSAGFWNGGVISRVVAARVPR